MFNRYSRGRHYCQPPPPPTLEADTDRIHPQHKSPAILIVNLHELKQRFGTDLVCDVFYIQQGVGYVVLLGADHKSVEVGIHQGHAKVLHLAHQLQCQERWYLLILITVTSNCDSL